MEPYTIDIEHFALFHGVASEAIDAVRDVSTLREIKKNIRIDFHADDTNGLHFIREGYVKLYRRAPGQQDMILDVTGPGDIIGEQIYFEEYGDEPEFAVTLVPSTLHSVHKTDFDRIVRIHPQLGIPILRRMGLRLRKMEERMTDILFKDVRTRIASFLVRHSEEFGKVRQQAIHVQPYLPHQDIALLTGSTRQTVTTILNEFRAQGIIDFSRQGFVIYKYERLQALSE